MFISHFLFIVFVLHALLHFVIHLFIHLIISLFIFILISIHFAVIHMCSFLFSSSFLFYLYVIVHPFPLVSNSIVVVAILEEFIIVDILSL